MSGDSALGSAPSGGSRTPRSWLRLVEPALVSAAVVVGMPDPRGALRAEALRLAARADAARERAMMDNRPVALVLKEGGYGFEFESTAYARKLIVANGGSPSLIVVV